MINLTNLEWKDVDGTYTYDEALKLESDGWRLPTIFELRQVHKDKAVGFTVASYWSSTLYTCSNSAFSFFFYNGNTNCVAFNSKKYIFLVRSETNFKHKTSIKDTDTLPNWHPTEYRPYKENNKMILQAGKEYITEHDRLAICLSIPSMHVNEYQVAVQSDIGEYNVEFYTSEGVHMHNDYYNLKELPPYHTFKKGDKVVTQGGDRRYFSHVSESGLPCCFDSGCDEWSSEGCTISWDSVTKWVDDE